MPSQGWGRPRAKGARALKPFLLLIPSSTAVNQADSAQAQISQRLPSALGTQFTLVGPGVTHLPAQQDDRLGSGVRNHLNILKLTQMSERKVKKKVCMPLKKGP